MKRILFGALAGLGFFVSPIFFNNGNYRVQEVTNSGRNYVTFTYQGNATAGEVLLTVAQNKQGTVTGGVTSYSVTNNKTLRITSVSYGIETVTAAIVNTSVAIRQNDNGTCVIGSNILYRLPYVSTDVATINAAGAVIVPIPEGLEIYKPNDGKVHSVCFSANSTTAGSQLTLNVSGYEY